MPSIGEHDVALVGPYGVDCEENVQQMGEPPEVLENLLKPSEQVVTMSGEALVSNKLKASIRAQVSMEKHVLGNALFEVRFLDGIAMDTGVDSIETSGYEKTQVPKQLEVPGGVQNYGKKTCSDEEMVDAKVLVSGQVADLVPVPIPFESMMPDGVPCPERTIDSEEAMVSEEIPNSSIRRNRLDWKQMRTPSPHSRES